MSTWDRSSATVARSLRLAFPAIWQRRGPGNPVVGEQIDLDRLTEEHVEVAAASKLIIPC
ncbi:hypothetical protein [Dactylosporangium sp. NPDC048998]|uniref:hypothetical protein n=1 Tax=Dactylosporangium sp. NPDC048998 TaxID=3363976 RepID=UPI0037151C61